jgi:hypothetical protein
MTNHATYKHINFLDVAMVVKKVQYRGPIYIKVKIDWILERNGEWLGSDVVKIQNKDLLKWKRI